MTEVVTDEEVVDAPSVHSANVAGRVGLGLLLVVSVVAFVGALTTLEFGTLAQPGPGLWIVGVSGAAVLLCAAALAAPGITRDEVDPLTGPEVMRLLTAAPALVLATPLIHLTGITIATLIVSLYWLKVPMQQSIIRSAVVATVLTAAIYLVFIVLLRVPFPTGSLAGI